MTKHDEQPEPINSPTPEPKPKEVHDRQPEAKRLYRSRRDSVIGGVAGGMADYFGMDPSLMRLIFILLVMLPGIGVIAYIVAWIVIPEEPKSSEDTKTNGDLDTKLDQWGKEVSDRFKDRTPDERSRNAFGLVLIGLGSIFLLQMFFDISIMERLWPLILVIIGLVIIFGRGRRA